MDVTTDGVAMFVHIAVAITSFAFAGILHTALIGGARATDVREMRAWVPIIRRVEPLLPVTALALLATGAWLIDLESEEVAWSDGWIIASLVALVVVEALGATLMPRTKRLTARIEEVGQGPVPEDLARMWRDPVLLGIGHLATATFLGVVFLMAAKPTGLASAAIVVAAGFVGVLTSVPFWRREVTTSRPASARPART